MMSPGNDLHSPTKLTSRLGTHAGLVVSLQWRSTTAGYQAALSKEEELFLRQRETSSGKEQVELRLFGPPLSAGCTDQLGVSHFSASTRRFSEGPQPHHRCFGGNSKATRQWPHASR